MLSCGLLLVYLCYVPDMLLVCSCFFFLKLIVALTSNGTRPGERKTPWPSQLLLTAVAASLLLPPQASVALSCSHHKA